MSKAFEERLEELRREALEAPIRGDGVHARGGPMPPGSASAALTNSPGYYGLPLLKPPVWEWMIPLYFFVGGLAGMSGLMAFGGVVQGNLALSRAALWFAAVGIMISPVFLIADLGRPLRFIYMLRVFKYQSPMSVGSWIVSGFGAFALPALLLIEWRSHLLKQGTSWGWLDALSIASIVGSAVFGVFLATYTGALVAVSAIPAWFSRRVILPFHFGISALGSAVGALEFCGFSGPQLTAIGFLCASCQTLVFLRSEFAKRTPATRALHEGKSGWMLRIAEILEGPLSLILRSFGLSIAAAIAFTLGSLLSRFGWIAAGRASACDPEAIFSAQPSPAPPNPKA
jgi:hypothetical protein